MDYSEEHISLFEKTQTVVSSSLSSISYIHSGISLAYTEKDHLNIHCAITNVNAERILIPDIKQTVFLFDNVLLYSTKDSVKYFSYPDKQILRSFPIKDPLFIQSKLIDDTFMIINQDGLQFNDLRYKNDIYRLNVRNCIGTLNNDSFAIIINNKILKIYDHGYVSPRITKKYMSTVLQLKFTNDNKYLVLNTEKSILLVETQTGETIHRFFIDNVLDFDISEDSQFIFFILRGKVSIFSIKDRQLLKSLFLNTEQRMIRANPSFSQFITAQPDFTFFSVDKLALTQQ